MKENEYITKLIEKIVATNKDLKKLRIDFQIGNDDLEKDLFTYSLVKLIKNDMKEYLIIVSELIKSLDAQEQKKYLKKLEKIDIEYAQKKKNITVKEFEEIYNISKSSQQDLRGRLYDPLPYHQKVERGKIVYVVEEVEKWFENQHK